MRRNLLSNLRTLKSKPLLLLILGLLLTCFFAHAQPAFLWAKQMGGTSISSAPSDVGRAIALDKRGNVYTTGNFYGKSDFDPGISTYYLTSSGASDVFISKLSNDGDFVWAKKFSGSNYNDGNDLTVDADGNVYVVGSFLSATDFDPGTADYTLTPLGYRDAFVCKFDSNGNFIWAKQFGGELPAMDQVDATGVAVDSAGNVYTTGAIWYGKADFDPGPSLYNLSTAGDFDIFISKLNSNGDFVWAKRMGSTKRDAGEKIAVDGKGYVYVTGYFSSTVDFDPGTNVLNLSTSQFYKDIFICRFDIGGNLSWAHQIGTTNGDDIGHDISVDELGNIYTTGNIYYGGADFDPGPANYPLTTHGSSDIFICKWDSSANFHWAKNIGASSMVTIGYSIAVAKNSVCITGYFGGRAGWAVDFDPGPGVYNMFCNPGTSSNSVNIFVTQLDTAGKFVCAGWMGGPTGIVTNTGYAIATDGNGNMYTTGQFVSSADFNPDSIGSYYLTTTNSLDDEDIFVSKLHCSSVTPTLPSADFQTSDTSFCGSACIHFSNLSSNATSWLWDFPGAVPSSDTSRNPQNICYTSIGSYNVKLIAFNTNGTDTLNKVSYIKNNPPALAGTVSALRDTICAGTPANLNVTGNSGSVQWQSSAAPEDFSTIAGAKSNTFIDIPSQTTFYRVLADSGKCSDTSAAYKIVVKPSPVASFTYVASGLEIIFNSDGSLDAKKFTWDFGDSTTSTLPDPVHAYSRVDTFHVCLTVENGSNCSFTICKDIKTDIGTGNTESSLQNNFRIYPNPSKDRLFVKGYLLNGEITIQNVLGQILLSKTFSSLSTQTELEVTDLPQGIYLLVWKNTEEVIVLKFVKN